MPHEEHLDGGETRESPRGTLYMQTLRKLPTTAPKTKGRTSVIMSSTVLFSIIEVDAYSVSGRYDFLFFSTTASISPACFIASRESFSVITSAGIPPGMASGKREVL